MNPSIDHGGFIVGLLRSVGARLSGLFGAADRVDPLVRPPDDDEEECDAETMARLNITKPGVYAVCDDDVSGPCETVDDALQLWMNEHSVRRIRFYHVESDTQREENPSPCGADVRDCNTDDTACNPKEPA